MIFEYRSAGLGAAAGAALGLLLLTSSDSADSLRPSVEVPASPRALPARFDAEVIRITVERDSLRVDGRYEFVIRAAPARTMSLLYPYPADSLLGGARTLFLEARSADGSWESLAFRELPARHAAHWRLPLDRGPRLEVRTAYRQALRGQYGRYIVTTTAAWGEPLSRARFEIRLPDNAVPLRFSYPFRKQETGEEIYYLFEADDFRPDQDVVFEWCEPPDE